MIRLVCIPRPMLAGAAVMFGLTFLFMAAHFGQYRATTAVSERPVPGQAVRVLTGPDPDAIYLQLQAGRPDIRAVPTGYEYWREDQVVVRMADFQTLMSPGEPMLPYQLFTIALPPEADPTSLELHITRLVEEKMPGEYRVAPAPRHERCQQPRPPVPPPASEVWGEGKRIVAGKNIQIYGSDAPFPASVGKVMYGGQLRKWKMAAVAFYPVRYLPVSGSLLLARQVDLKISFRRDREYLKRADVVARLRDNAFDRRAKALMLNARTAERWYRQPLLDTLPAGKSGEDPADPNFAIITTEETFTNTATAAGALDDYCFHKENLGFQVMVVTEHQVRVVAGDSVTGYSFSPLAGVGGYEDVAGAPAPGQRPEKVRKWLQDNYIPLGIVYVLLIGNPDPDNMAADDAVGDLPMKNTQLHLFADVPTDFYFAELTGDWDLDGDGYAGEYYPPTGETYGIPAAVTPGLFSVRWEGVLEVTGAVDPVSILLYVSTEGQTRIWLDQDNNGLTDADLVMEDATVHWPAYVSHWTELANGQYAVRIEYVQAGGDAYMSLNTYCWTEGVGHTLKHDDGSGTYVDDLAADYFANTTFSGAPAAEVDDRSVYLYHAAGDKGPGGVEFYADVIVGRIPCYDEDQDGSLDYDQLNHILNKTITYETAVASANPWRLGILASAPYVANYDDTAGDYTVAKYEWAEMLRDGVALPAVWDWFRIYEQTYPGVVPDAEVHTGCSTTQTETAWNDPADPDDGRGVVMWMTHGSQTSARKVFDNDQCATLDDSKPSIVFMGACNNGEPEFRLDYYGQPVVPLGYANLKSGAIGTVSASRSSYG